MRSEPTWIFFCMLLCSAHSVEQCAQGESCTATGGLGLLQQRKWQQKVALELDQEAGKSFDEDTVATEEEREDTEDCDRLDREYDSNSTEGAIHKDDFTRADEHVEDNEFDYAPDTRLMHYQQAEHLSLAGSDELAHGESNPDVFPRVDSVSPNGGGLLGANQVVVKGVNLWPGNSAKTDLGEFTPPLTICLQNQPCDVDYFSSSSTKVVCKARPFNTTNPANEKLSDYQVKQQLTLSDNLCKQVESQVPGGHVFKKDEFIRTGSGFCDHEAGLIRQENQCPSVQQCMKYAAETPGAKSFSWRSNTYQRKQPCRIYDNNCFNPKGNGLFHVYSVVPAIPAVFFKHKGEFVGGLVNQKWNNGSQCIQKPYMCGYDYDNHHAAKVLDVFPTVTAPGKRITLIGTFFEKNVALGGRVWLIPENNQSAEPTFCRTVDDKGIAYNITHTTVLHGKFKVSVYSCEVPVGIVTGQYHVSLVHDFFGEALPFKSLTVLARIDSVARKGSDLMLKGASLDEAGDIDVGGRTCKTKGKANFHALTCAIDPKASWTKGQYPGGAGALIEIIRLGTAVAEEPESFDDAVIMAAKKGVKPEILHATSLAPPQAIDNAESNKIFFSRSKAMLRAPKDGEFRLAMRNVPREGYALLSLMGVTAAKAPHHATVSPIGETPCNESFTGKGQDYRGCQNKTRSGYTCQRWSSSSPHKPRAAALPSRFKDDNDDHNYCRNANGAHFPWCLTTDPKKTWEYCVPISPPSQVEFTSVGGRWAHIQMTLKKGDLMLVQLERAHVDVATYAGVQIELEEMHRGRLTGKKTPVDASLLVRHYSAPQVVGSKALCGIAAGCPLPKGDTVALLQTESLPRPAHPERAHRAKEHTFSMQNLSSLKRRIPGIGLIANPGIKASFLQLEPVTVTTTDVHNGTCYWGPFTLMSTLPGCIPGDDCKKYSSSSEAQKACGKIGFQCGGIVGVGKKENNYTHWEARQGRWLESIMQGESMEKLACGKFHLRVKDAGAPGKPRGCALSGFQVEGEFGRSLSDCQKYCLQSSPRRPTGLLSTQWVEYHNDTYCGCFSTCEMTRRPENFASTADIYEFVSPDINTHEHVPYLNRYKNNPCLNKVCKFSDKSTWGPSGVPSRKDTDMIYIPENVTLLMDQSVFIRYWVVEGTMTFDRKDLLIQAEGIFVNGGSLLVGTSKAPFENKLTFEMFGHWHSFKIPVFGSKVIGATTGNIEFYGKPIKTTWTELAKTAKKGEKILRVLGKGAEEWAKGSRIVVTSTDRPEAECDSDRNDHCQTEEAEVLLTERDHSSNTTILHLKDKLKYRHLVQEITGSRGEDMDIRAEVGLLSRNVRVIGSQDRDGTQHFGAQLMMLKVDKVALEYVEFYHVGQAHQLGRYPVHFHHSGNVHGRAHVRGCAIHRTFNRAVTNHATDGLLVERNVAYNVQGHAFFFEDAVETNAIYRYNLGVMIRPSFSLLQVDMTPAVFWVTNPRNYIYGNHAVGGQGFGFWFDIQSSARGLSHGKHMAFSPKGSPLGLFQNNTAHSNGRSLWITNYDPRDDKGQRAVAIFDKTKSWGNANGVEVLEAGHIWVRDHVSISDGEEGIAYAITFADGWGSSKNDWNSPVCLNSTIRSQSKLPAYLWTVCGVHGPTNDYVSVNGLHVADSFRKGFFCGCKWCPGLAGGLETRFRDTKFLSRGARRMDGWRHNFDSMIYDVDGSVSGLGKCHLHGCMIHPWIGKRARSTGHLPKAHCKSHQVGVVCTSNVALRTLRIRNAQPFKTKFKSITIKSNDGASGTDFYFYDFRRGRQAGGLYHFTVASAVTHEVQWNLGAQVVDIEAFGGEICNLRSHEEEYFLLSLKTLANPVTFSFNGKHLSLNKMAKLGCPKQCNGCNAYLDGRNRCTARFHTNHVNCMGCQVPPNNHSNHRLLMVGHECRSRDASLGEFTSLDNCAEACLKRKGCEYFVYGHGAKRGRCYQEKTTSEKCPEGYEPDAYDFYAVRRNTTAPPQMSGVDFLSLNKQSASNGLWQYDSAVESFDYEKWRPGLFTGLINAKVSGARNGRWGPWDGSDDDHPFSKWGSTSLQPCANIHFGRNEGVVSACADEKDQERVGMDVPPQTLRWCSDDWEKQEFKNYYMKTVFEKNDTMLIPGTWKVYFNCNKTVNVKILEIYGELIFEEGADRHLMATHIFISYMGALRIGTAGKPFGNKATISLDGHRRTPMWPAGDLGNKFIASSGVLELFGGSRPTWTRLAKAAAAGDKTIILEKDLQLKAGDEVLVTTNQKTKETEEHKVASVNGAHVTLVTPLAHPHAGLDSTVDGNSETKGYLAVEVAALRGNIVIEGLDTPGWKNVTALKQERWGANIKVFAVSDVCGAKKPQLRMEGVELRYCGKDNTACISVVSAADGAYIKHSVVRYGLGTGMMGGFGGIETEADLIGNVVYGITSGHGISSGGTVKGNLVTASGYGFKGWSGRASLEDNVASGLCCFAEFKQPGGVGAYVSADKPGSWVNRRNLVRGATNGVILQAGDRNLAACKRTLPDESAYPVISGCGMLEHITIVNIEGLGVRASGGSVLLKNMLFINAHKGVVLSGTGDNSETHAANSHDIRLQVTHSKFYVGKGRCGGWAVAGAQFYNAWMRLHRPLKPPSFYGGTVVENVHFYGYGTCAPALTNDGPGWVFGASDGSHYPMFTANLKFTGGNNTRLVKFFNPGACVQMKCDGRRSSMLTDTDGTLLGYKGTVLARNEQAFNYKLLPHAFRFDWNGSTIPENILYKGKGAYRAKDCTLDTHWNAWKCKSTNYRQVIIESLDHDWLERRYAPVSVETTDDLSAPYGGFAAMYTGPGTANTGMIQAFWTMAHLDMRHNIYFASANPLLTRIHLRDATPDQGVLLCIYYGLPNRVEVYRGYSKKRVFPMAEPTWDDHGMPQLKVSYPNGANIYDRIGMGKDKRPGYLYVVLKGPEPLELRVTKKIKLTKRLEVGEQEFIYKKGSQGLVRNIALLLNIPESRIKVVGLGRMMDKEIWGKHNGVANNYTPPDAQMGGRYSKLLETAPAKPEVAEVIIDPVENENEDEAEPNEHELVDVFANADEKCKEGSLIKCKGNPEIDSIPPPGWTCNVTKYNTDDGCDCDCGIWDPDCDKHFNWGYGKEVATDGKIELLDTSRVETLLRIYDKSPKDHKIGTDDMMEVKRSLSPNNALRVLAQEMEDADDKYVPLLKVATKSNCGREKACLMNPKQVLTKDALPMGVCVDHKIAKKGSACDANPCGVCKGSKCVADQRTSFGYSCVPTGAKVALASASTGKFGEWVRACFGRRRSRRCYVRFVPAAQKVGNGNGVYQYKFRGPCNATNGKVIPSAGATPQLCMAAAKKAKYASLTWNAVSKVCTIWPEACNGRCCCRGRSCSRHWTYMLEDSMQTVIIKPLKQTGLFMLESDSSKKHCLKTNNWGTNPHCAQCSETDATQHWQLEMPCNGKAMLKSADGKKCMQAMSDTEFKMVDCDVHYKAQHFNFLALD